jgi:SAM-dependent methyltransferase
MASQERFGYEWHRYGELIDEYRTQFLNWTFPWKPEDWRGKRLLDAGCGMGRNTYWPMIWGAASAVAFDYDERTVARARALLQKFPAVQVVYQNIYTINWHDEFDVVVSIGVIDHLIDPRRALHNLVRALKPGGRLLVWVYGYEGYEWVVRYVDPVRKLLTSRLPVGVVHTLSYLCSVPLFLFLKIFRGPTPYLRQIARFKLWHIHSIVFDQLIPEVVHYWKRDEIWELASSLNLKEISIEPPPNRCGWVMCGVKPPLPPAAPRRVGRRRRGFCEHYHTIKTHTEE